MAETQSNQASSDMEVSSLPPSPGAKDRAPPSTPSSISTNTSNGEEPPQENPKDTEGQTEEALPATAEEGTESSAPKEENAADEIETNDNDDALLSDEEKEDVKNSSFDKGDNEIPSDKINQTTKAKSSGGAPTEEIADSPEERVPEIEKLVEESPSKPKEDDAEDNTDEIAVEEVVAQNDSGEPEPDTVEEETQDSTKNDSIATGEEVAAQEDPEKNTPKEEKPQESLEIEAPSNIESCTLGSTESACETPDEEAAVENDESEKMPQKEEPAKESEPVVVEVNTGDSAENTVETSGEEVATQNDETENVPEEGKAMEPLQKESSPDPERNTEDTKSITAKVQFDVSSDDDQSDDNKEAENPPAALITPSSGGVSFAQAFSTSPLPATMNPPLVSPRSTSNASVSSSGSFQESNADTPTSHSALSASKNKKASGLISKYQEKIAHEALPGDSVPIRKPSPKGNFLSNMSPGTARMLQQKSAKAFVELNSLPDMNSVRAKFEKSSLKSDANFEFGETFRQKKRHEQLSGKEQEVEAKVAIRGFNEKILNNGKTATAEIDTSSLPKSFTFDMANAAPLFPNDGICRVDYTNADFRAKVFVVHKTRGMLLLQDKHASMYTSKSSGKKKKKRMNTVPGGKINEEEFLAAAKESGSPQVQLQIAARDAAARHVFMTTGLDIRQQADRLKPAVLCMAPSMNTARGYEYLRNENEEKLYYFLQVDEDDFEKLQEEQGKNAQVSKSTKPSEDPGEDPAPVKLERPSEDTGDDPLTLKLSSDYSGYEFVQDPVKASKVLKKDGNDAAIALAMIMTAAAQEITPTADEPDAKATEYASKTMLDDELDDEEPNDGTTRTVGIKEDEEGKPMEDAEGKSTEDADGKATEDTAGKSPTSDNGKSFYDEEAKLQIKSSTDTTDQQVGVSCCCGFW